MATVWKKEIKKVKSPFSEKELLTMSFKEYWARGFGYKPLHPEMEIGPEGHMYSPGSIWFRKELKRLARAKQDFKSDMYAQDTMKIELPDKYKNYPSHLADMEV
jgi:hypothetical protein